jgi:predicted Na+-dependent transporter
LITRILVAAGRGKDREKLKKLKKFLPLLLIPVALQFLLLPMVLGTLKMMATKAVIAAKLALLLVIFNAVWAALMPQGVEHNTRVASEQYGYEGAPEYGAYINKRALAYKGQM